MKRDLLRLRRVFRQASVLDMEALSVHFSTRSRRSLFRDLDLVGYQTSYTHGGRYYTLADLPEFDDWGLWFYGDIRFSRNGTLKESSALQVEQAPDGRTHGELSHLFRVRVHNTLLELVREGRIASEAYRGKHLYVSAAAEQAAEQVRQRHEGDRAVARILRAATVEETIEILAEALRGAAEIPSPLDVVRGLAVRGVSVEPSHVRSVYRAHGLAPGKKTAPPT